MVRTITCAVLALAIFSLTAAAADKAAKKNQMVKGTIKSVDVKSGVLIVSQQLKGEKVDRQLDIRDVTEFVIKKGSDTKELTGKAGLAELDGQEGATVQVKCDKDVNVLKVTVTLKK